MKCSICHAIHLFIASQMNIPATRIVKRTKKNKPTTRKWPQSSFKSRQLNQLCGSYQHAEGVSARRQELIF